MANLRIEYVPIQKFALGWFGFDHLQLVFEPDTIPMVPNPQDDWFVLEGDSETTDHGALLGVIGESGSLTMSVANLAYGPDLVAKIGTPETRGSRILSPNVSVINAWTAMATYGAQIQMNDFPYLAYGSAYSPYPTFNSSSVVASLLWQVGIDVNTVMPFGVGISPGTATYLGTENNDVLAMPTSNFTTLAGGYGNDDLSGTDVWYRVDKLFGGGDNDTFHWSTGWNIIHGGDPSLDADNDGYDRVDYQKAGTITVNRGRGYIKGFSPDYVVTFTGNGNGGGTDWLYSIESIRWDALSDTIIWGRGVTGIEENLSVDMGGQDTKKGDTADFNQSQFGIVMLACEGNEQVRISLADGDASSKSWWINGAESIIGSAHGDELHLVAGMVSAEGGDGNDILDSRNVLPGTGLSPNGYDVELNGGTGQDTLIAGAGRTLAKGGDGSDTFILSKLSENGQKTEFIVDDASEDNRLFVPLNFFNGSIGAADNSLLMPILGGIGDWAIFNEYTAGMFIHQTTEQSGGLDQTIGIIPFVGQIFFYRDGNDLLISLIPGYTATRTISIEGLEPYTITYANLDFSRETFVRIRNFHPGLLGITFDVPTIGDTVLYDENGLPYVPYTNWTAIAQRVTAGGNYTSSLMPNPVGALPPQTGPSANPANRISIHGTSSDDTIDLTTGTAGGGAPLSAGTSAWITAGDGNDTVLTGASNDTIQAGAGNDTLATGAGEDILDGGAGADTMMGGADDDTYIVNNAGDLVVELASQGRDTVESSVDYTLTANVENLTMTGTAVRGTGNSRRNTITGNDADNILDGGAGDDTLYGGDGDDTLIGGSGSDAYVYRAGTGHKTIIDTGSSIDTDTLVLADGIKPEDIRAYRLSSSPNDLVIGFTFGGWVALIGQLTGAGIEDIVFDDGTVWTRADIAALDAPLLAFPPPEALDDSNIVIFGTQATVPGIAVLGNDLSFDANLTIIAVNNVSSGAITIDAGGNLVVSAPPGFVGNITFTYTIIDGHGETAVATATIYVAEPAQTPVNTAPSLTSDAAGTFYRNTPISLTAASLLANDTDANGDPLAIVSVGSPAGGQIVLQVDGSLVFTPTTDYTGPASFTYTVSDGQGATSTTTVTLTIAAPPAITRIGSDGNDNLIGGDGDDTLAGLGGQDSLDGGLGSDSMTGGDGNDIYAVNHTGDLVIETTGSQETGGLDLVHATINYVLPDFVEQLSLEGAATSGTGNALNNLLDGRQSSHILTLDGGAGDDILYGSGLGYNALIGGDGKDTLYAAGTGNVMTGGLGNDTYYSQSATDIIVEQAAGGFDTLYANESVTSLTANVEALVLRGNAASATANALDNTLSATTTHGVTIDAGAGNDTITGTNYDDILTGGAGIDLIDLRKGGHDTLRYTAAGFGRDNVLGFDAITLSGRDYIDLTGRGFTAASLGRTILIASSSTGAVISIGTDTINLSGVSASLITAANFKF